MSEAPSNMEGRALTSAGRQQLLPGYDELNVNTILKRYNKLLDFVPEQQLGAEGFRKADDKIRTARANMELIMQQATQQLRQEHDRIQAEIKTVMDEHVQTEPHWYDRYDIFALSKTHIRELFDNRPVKDAAHFAHYLFRTAKAHLAENLPAYRTDIARYFVFTEKIIALKDALSDSKDPAATQHYLPVIMFIKLQAVPRRGHFHHLRPRIVMVKEGLDEEIQHCLRTASSEPTSFRNAAAARRELWSIYSFKSCPNDFVEVHTDVHTGKTWREEPCFHQLEVPVLALLQQQAYKEIRRNVLLAVGQYLPADVTEMVVDSMLDVEEVPRYASIFAEEADHSKSGGRDLRQAYRCGRYAPAQQET